MALLVSTVFFMMLSCRLYDSAVLPDRKYGTLLKVPNGAPWGNWRKIEVCPKGYVNGYSLKVQSYQGPQAWDDDTGLNGVRLYCTDGEVIESESGEWGDWSEINYCPQGNIVAFALQTDPPRGIIDDTAANNVKFQCSLGAILIGNGHHWGEFGEWSDSCYPGSVCGLRTKMDVNQGAGDDTALNDLELYCCK